MPMIDVTAPAGLLPAATHDTLRRRLGEALLRAERAPLAPPFTDHTGVFLHELPPAAVGTAGEPAATVVRVQVTTPPGALDRDGQRELVSAATTAVADAVGDPAQAGRTWVLLTEAAEGGWGVGGVALGHAEFAALRAGR
ncbi:tautomerase family protein [Nocardioides rubriscoriae]|uniref:tautomerase family protein n=1 Tax=Nocardioides rubriscoriae TaxID=642762 RepID=UPI0011E009D4|nr:tautomerase family protein [Nocardioides rubriscoriae]